MAIARLITPLVIDWIRKSVGSSATVRSVTRLKGSTSSDLFRVILTKDDLEPHLVLRLFTNQQWLQEEPNVAAHEAAALQAVASQGLPTPRLVASDTTGEECGWQAILMTRLPGRVTLQPADFDQWLFEQAAFLHSLHAFNGVGFGWTYFPYVKPSRAVLPGWSSLKREWERAFEIVRQPPPPGDTSFIHRDFHPMNTLWLGQTLSGVVDWVNACRGPASFDAAWMQINLVQMYGLKAAERFLVHYDAFTHRTLPDQPYWDLMALLEFTAQPPTVYPPWRQFGLGSLTNARIRQRLEQYLVSVLVQYHP